MKKSTQNKYGPPWWFEWSLKHACSDVACRRRWTCTCGACGEARKETGLASAGRFVQFCAQVQVAWAELQSTTQVVWAQAIDQDKR